MAKKENQRIILTKRLLQEGLLRLLETKDLEKISVTELCRESGINRATFYNHYGSPQELLMDLEIRLAEELNQIIIDPKHAGNAFLQLEAACTYYRDNAQSIIVLARCHADTDLADAFYRMNQNLRHQLPHMTRISNLDPGSQHLVSTFLYTGCYHVIREWLIKDIQKTPGEIAELLLSIINKEFH